MSLVEEVFDYVKQNPGINGVQIQNKFPNPLVSPSIQQLESDGLILWKKEGYIALQNELKSLNSSLDDTIDAVTQIIKDQWLKECPRCHKSAQGEDPIRQKFGFRRSNGKVIPQSYCIKCRSKKIRTGSDLQNDSIGFSRHTIQEAKNMWKGINLEGVIKEKEIPKKVNLRCGDTINVGSAYLVDDNDDQIKITLWGEDIKRIKNGSRIRILNAHTTKYRGEISVSPGKYGTLNVIYYGERERRKEKFTQKFVQEPILSDDPNWIIDSDDLNKNEYLNSKSDEFEAKIQDFKF